MSSAFSTRWIGPQDTAILDRVAPGVFDHAINQDRLAAYLARDTNWLGVALHDDLVIGMCMAVIHHHPDKPTEIFLDEIGTGDDWRRQGVADLLLKMLYERADEAGIDEIWVATETDNVPARGLYEKSGAKPEKAVYYYLEW